MRHRLLYAAVALVAIGVVAAVIYLETSNSAAPPPTTTTTTTTLPSTTTSSTTTTSTSTTSTSTTTSTTLPPTTTLPPLDRSLISVVVASGSPNGERVGPTADLLRLAGYGDVRALNGSVATVFNAVYFIDGFRAEAEVLAGDVGIDPATVAPIEEAPPVAGLGGSQLVFYLGG